MKKFCYKPLWKLLIDREITKTELMSMAQISQSSMQKLRTNKNVTTDVNLYETFNGNISVEHIFSTEFVKVLKDRMNLL